MKVLLQIIQAATTDRNLQILIPHGTGSRRPLKTGMRTAGGIIQAAATTIITTVTVAITGITITATIIVITITVIITIIVTIVTAIIITITITITTTVIQETVITGITAEQVITVITGPGITGTTEDTTPETRAIITIRTQIRVIRITVTVIQTMETVTTVVAALDSAQAIRVETTVRDHMRRTPMPRLMLWLTSLTTVSSSKHGIC